MAEKTSDEDVQKLKFFSEKVHARAKASIIEDVQRTSSAKFQE